MELHLTGKTAVITGASKGIGLAVAQAFAEEGVRVVAGARELSDDLTQLVGRYQVHFVAVDLSTPDGPARLVAEAVSTFGGLDILVNNVGAVHPRLEGFLAITDGDWNWGLNINFLAAVWTIRAALPHMLDRNAGAIVTISSVNAFLPDPSIYDYCAAKAALSNVSKALSKEVGPRGIRVNTISPGPVATQLWLGRDGVEHTGVGQAGEGEGDAHPDRVAGARVSVNHPVKSIRPPWRSLGSAGEDADRIGRSRG